jgi:translocation protein SEC72
MKVDLACLNNRSAYTSPHSKLQHNKRTNVSALANNKARIWFQLSTPTMDLDTFQQLPLQLDGATKAVSCPQADSKLEEELSILNQLHRALLGPDTSNAIPPPPVPVNPKRSAQVQKMREAGNTAFKKQQYAEAIKLYSLGIDMASGRPAWEPSGLVREELSHLYSNRAQAYMGSNNWPEGAVDAQCSVDLKKVANSKAWWRRGKCLLEMGRVEEARDWVAEGLEVEHEQELVALMEEIEKKLKAT